MLSCEAPQSGAGRLCLRDLGTLLVFQFSVTRMTLPPWVGEGRPEALDPGPSSSEWVSPGSESEAHQVPPGVTRAVYTTTQTPVSLSAERGDDSAYLLGLG